MPSGAPGEGGLGQRRAAAQGAVAWQPEFVTEFLERGLLGFYFTVVREGEVGAGDPIVELARDPRAFRVTEIARLYTTGRDDVEGMRRAADLDALPESWRDYFRKRLEARAA
jgi:MOSC domain-containing protein YiiM